MAELADVMAYFCSRYPNRADLSKARLTKMIYLADWRMALTAERQITDLKWIFNHYGPYLEDIRETALAHSERFTIRSEVTPFGGQKEVIGLVSDEDHFEVDAPEAEVLDYVIEKTKDMTWGTFIKFVYSTYPIATQPRYAPLNLVELAARYSDSRASLT